MARSVWFRVGILNRRRQLAYRNERKLLKLCTSATPFSSTRRAVGRSPQCKTQQFRPRNVGPLSSAQNETPGRLIGCVITPENAWCKTACCSASGAFCAPQARAASQNRSTWAERRPAHLAPPRLVVGDTHRMGHHEFVDVVGEKIQMPIEIRGIHTARVLATWRRGIVAPNAQ